MRGAQDAGWPSDEVGVSGRSKSWLTPLARFGSIAFLLLAVLGAALVLALHGQMRDRSDEVGIGPLVVTIGLGLLVVYLELLAVVAWGSRRLRRQIEHSEYLATHDPLTDLPNRMHVMRTLAAWLPDEEGRTMWVALLNLVRFSEINDVMGHARGDKVLIELSRRLVDVVGPGGFVGRLAADEFVVVWFATPDANHEAAIRTLLGELFA